MRRFSLTDVKRGIGMWQQAFPIKLRKIFVANCGRLLSPMVKATRALLAPKLRERVVIVDRTFDQLHGHVPPSNLPSCLGGTLDLDWEAHVESCFGVDSPGESDAPAVSLAMNNGEEWED